jgi:hypothetical protein
MDNQRSIEKENTQAVSNNGANEIIYEKDVQIFVETKDPMLPCEHLCTNLLLACYYN